jgi:transcriptional antiterminator RfaH
MHARIAMDWKATAERKRAETNAKELSWYCLRSQPKHEHIAAAHLRKLERVTVFCPRIKFKRTIRQGTAWVTEAMFPGYLFAQFELSEMQRLVRYTHGVSGIVQFGGRYPTIEDRALAHLQEQTGVGEIMELNYQLCQGDSVKIVEGAFVGLEAVVTQVVPAKERIKILMEFLGRKVEAEVEHASVLLEVAHPLAA